MMTGEFQLQLIRWAYDWATRAHLFETVSRMSEGGHDGSSSDAIDQTKKNSVLEIGGLLAVCRGHRIVGICFLSSDVPLDIGSAVGAIGETFAGLQSEHCFWTDSDALRIAVAGSVLGVIGLRPEREELSAAVSGRRCSKHLRRECGYAIAPIGTEFETRVWGEVSRIPVGAVRSYREVAASLGMPRSFRAVGNAVANNPLAVVIPCHRVIRSDGTFGNYRWGKDTKKRLIDFERHLCSNQLPTARVFLESNTAESASSG